MAGLPWMTILNLFNKSGETNGKQGGGFGNALSAPKDTTLSLGTAVVQGVAAHRLKKRADAAMPQWYDPQQMAFLSELGQKRRAMETGAEFAAGMNAIGASTAGSQQAISQAGAGNVGGTIQGLLQAQRVGQDAQNRVLGEGQQYGLQYNNMYNELLDKVAARKMELQLAKHSELMGQWAERQKAAESNLMAGIARMNSPLRRDQPVTPVSSTDTQTSQPVGAGQTGAIDPSMLDKLKSGTGGISSASTEGEAGGVGSNLTQNLA